MNERLIKKLYLATEGMSELSAGAFILACLDYAFGNADEVKIDYEYSDVNVGLCRLAQEMIESEKSVNNE